MCRFGEHQCASQEFLKELEGVLILILSCIELWADHIDIANSFCVI